LHRQEDYLDLGLSFLAQGEKKMRSISRILYLHFFDYISLSVRHKTRAVARALSPNKKNPNIILRIRTSKKNDLLLQNNISFFDGLSTIE